MAVHGIDGCELTDETGKTGVLTKGLKAMQNRLYPKLHTFSFILSVSGLLLLLVGCPPPRPCEFGFGAPTADAGADQNVQVGQRVTLNGNASTDPDGGTLTYQWQQTSGPAANLENPSGAMASFVPQEEGVYVFALTVSDGRCSDEQTVQISAFRDGTGRPLANAGLDFTVNEGGRSICLTGIQSADPNGSPLTFSWAQLSGSNVSLSNPFVVEVCFDAPDDICGDQVLVFELTAVNEDQLRDTDDVVVTVRDLNGACCTSDADCDDHRPCTEDRCDATAGSCVFPLIQCQEGQACDEMTGDCSDIDACRDVVCDDDGLFCNGVEFCENGACSSSGDPCSAAQTCDEDSESCTVSTGCTVDADCDDNDACTVDSCSAAGEPIFTADFRVPGIDTEGISFTTGSGFNWDSRQGGHYQMRPSLGPAFGTGVFDLTEPQDLLLRMEHLTSLIEGAFRDGFSPIDVVINDKDGDPFNNTELLLDNYDVGTNHGGSHALQVDEFVIPAEMLVPGENSISIAWANDGGGVSQYWITSLSASPVPELTTGACVFDPVVCDAEFACDPSTGDCVAAPSCTADADCDDLTFCNGVETCVNGFCQAGVPPCASGEACDEATGECTPSCGETDTICSSESVTGAIDPVADQDAYTFTGQAEDVVFIQVNRTSGGLNPQIRLFPPDNGPREALAGDSTFNDHSRAALFEHPLAETGQYTILILDDGLNSTGDYILSLLNLSQALTSLQDSDGGPIAFGETRTGAVDPVADQDVYTFNGQAGQLVFIQANRTSGGLNPQIRLYPPSGLPREALRGDSTFNDHSIAALFEHPLAESGQYTILVLDDGLSSTGEYILSLDFLP